MCQPSAHPSGRSTKITVFFCRNAFDYVATATYIPVDEFPPTFAHHFDMSSILQRLSRRDTAQRKSAVTRSGLGKTRCIGIEIDVDIARVATLGTCTSKAAQLNGGSANAQQWTTYTKLPLCGSSPSHGESSIDSPKKLGRWMEQLFDVLPRTVDGHRSAVTICLPPSWTHYEMTREGDMPATIANCQSLFKNSIFQCNAEIRVWNACKTSDRLVVVAVPHQATLEIARGVRRLGYEVSGIVPHGIALAGAASALTTLNPSCIALIGRAGGLVSTIGCGSDRNHLHGLCRHVSSSPTAACIDSDQIVSIEEIEPQLSSIAHEITATMSYANRINEFRASHENENHPVLIAGDLAATPGLDEALASLIHLPVAVWRYVHQERPLSLHGISPMVIDAEAATSLSLAHLSATMIRLGERQ